MPSSAISMLDASARRAQTQTVAWVACEYLATLASASRGDEVRRQLDGLGQPLGASRTTPSSATVERVASASSAAASPCSSTAGWMPRASSRSSASDRASSSLAVVTSSSADGSSRIRFCEEPQLQRDRDQALLRAVVQVALEPPALGVAGRDDPLARGLQLGQPRLRLGLQVLVLERDRGRRA